MQKRGARIALSAVGGMLFAAAWIGSALSDQIWIAPAWLRILIVIGFALVGAGLFYFSLQWLERWGARSSRKALAWGLLICLLAGALLAFVIPVRGMVLPVEHTLHLTATGERNEKSQASEVRLEAIIAGGLPYQPNLKQLCSGDWKFEGGTWISNPDQASSLVCRVRALDEVVLRFGVGDRAGVVSLIADQLPTEKEDLYADTVGSKEITVTLQSGRKQILAANGMIFSAGLWIGWILFVVGLFLIQRPSRSGTSPKIPPWYAYTLALIVVWLLYLIAFWPGFMNSDALDQWGQMTSGRINDWHPAFHTLTFWVITRVWYSPAAVALAQILVLAILVGLILAYLRQKEAQFWIVMAILVMLCLPPYGLAVISLWKDIPFSIAVLGFSFCILLIVESAGRWIERPLSWIGLGAIATLVGLYRHNGAPGAFITLGLLVLAYPGYRKQMLAALLTAMVLFLGVCGPLFAMAGVHKEDNNPGLQLALAHLIARHTRAHTPLLAEERRLLASIRNDEGIWPYNCYGNNPLAFDGKLDLKVLRGSTYELAQLALKLTERNPSETLKHFTCNGAFVFRVLPPMSGRRYSPYEASPLNLAANEPGGSVGPRIHSFYPELRDLIYRWTGWMYFSALSWFFWRSPFWMYLLIFAASIAAIRTGRWTYLLLLAPALLVTFPLAAISFIQAFRLVLPVMLVSLTFSGYLLSLDRA